MLFSTYRDVFQKNINSFALLVKVLNQRCVFLPILSYILTTIFIIYELTINSVNVNLQFQIESAGQTFHSYKASVLLLDFAIFVRSFGHRLLDFKGARKRFKTLQVDLSFFVRHSFLKIYLINSLASLSR